jgi:hypothetical protein
LFCSYYRAARIFRGIEAAILCAIVLLFPVLPSRAYDTDSQLWTQFVLNGRFQNGVRIAVEAQPRVGDNFQRLSLLILRPVVGYQVTRNMSLWIGYGWTPSFLPDFNNEHRVFQQVLFEDRYRRIGLINRTRLEERVIEGAGGTSVRLRHMLRAVLPLDSQRRWSAVGQNELFVNLNSTARGPQSGFDQNRIYVGGLYDVDRHTRVELGYQANFINAPRSRPDRRLDTLLLAVNYFL